MWINHAGVTGRLAYGVTAEAVVCYRDAPASQKKMSEVEI